MYRELFRKSGVVMPFDTSTIPAQVKLDARTWWAEPVRAPTEVLTSWLAGFCDVEDAMFVRAHNSINERLATQGRRALRVKRFSFEHGALCVCVMLLDIVDRAPIDAECVQAEKLVRLAWVPKTADEVINVPGAQARWDSRI